MSRLKIVYRQGDKTEYLWLDRCRECPDVSDTGKSCQHVLTSGMADTALPDDGYCDPPAWCPMRGGPVVVMLEDR